jgi:mycothiol synthase
VGEVGFWLGMADVEALVAVLPEGRIAAYADLSDQAEEHHRFWIDPRVPPGEHDAELAGALIDALEARASKAAAPGATVKVLLPAEYELVVPLLKGRGYELVRHSFRMAADLDADRGPASWPEGVAVRTFVPGTDGEAVYEAHQESFADQFEFVREPYDEWRRSAFREPFDPSLWLLAEHGAEIAGVCLCRSEWGADSELGWVSVLGVRGPWRGRGIGLALLEHAFAELRSRGKRRVGLGVDASNPTGAVRLYERAGMSVIRRSDIYERRLRA